MRSLCSNHASWLAGRGRSHLAPSTAKQAKPSSRATPARRASDSGHWRRGPHRRPQPMTLLGPGLDQALGAAARPTPPGKQGRARLRHPPESLAERLIALPAQPHRGPSPPPDAAADANDPRPRGAAQTPRAPETGASPETEPWRASRPTIRHLRRSSVTVSKGTPLFWRPHRLAAAPHFRKKPLFSCKTTSEPPTTRQSVQGGGAPTALMMAMARPTVATSRARRRGCPPGFAGKVRGQSMAGRIVRS